MFCVRAHAKVHSKKFFEFFRKKKKTQAEVYRGEVATIVKRSSTVNFLRSEETRDRAIRFSVSRYQFFFLFFLILFYVSFRSVL